jgi:hypothetical protein
MTSLALFAFSSWLVFASVQISNPALPSLPPEPDEATRIDEIYDQESRLFLSLYSLNGNGEVDYVTGRTVQGHIPVYYLPEHPIFYWWNHTMWNDPLLDGVNGNELVYKEETEFDTSRYKPCLFNGQPC